MSEETIPAEYLRSFNDGYLMAKHVPNFSAAAIRSAPIGDTPNLRIQGLKDGANEYAVERYRARHASKTPNASLGKTPPKSGPDISR